MEKLLISLIRKGIFKDQDPWTLQQITPEQLASLLALSKHHDVTHIVSNGLAELRLLGNDSCSKTFKNCARQMFVHSIWMEKAFREICATLDAARIPYIPLKGAVIRDYYPEAWLRNSCDIDILVPESMLEKAQTALISGLNYQSMEKGTHDVSLYSPQGIHLELHYRLMSEFVPREQTRILSQVWESAIRTEGYRYVLTDALFYFHQIAHMASHVRNGGCGVRIVLDIWMLNHKVDFCPETRRELLQQGGLLIFAQAAEQLAEMWFGNGTGNLLTEQLENFILTGGAYGTRKNRIAISQAKSGGKLQLVMSKIFLPYTVLKYQYPILQKWKILTPLFQVVRWLRIAFGSSQGAVKEKARINATITREEMTGIQNLLKELNL